ncbi:hypothetical protein [Streptomyces lunaelactis]|uniref:hypothetical protein n=1 Tax=Streptomyces lunaelactis TaxID=1535768 RepID=UPI001584D1EC|nr:hypothetical protein [Streptomyces lunaelactis]NUK14040.1 hypothetical protein [Streptomyces lunaelactis]
MTTMSGADGRLPRRGWQRQILPLLTKLAAEDGRIRDLRPHGSVLDSEAGIDCWSDLDLVITTEAPSSVAEDFAQQISARLSPIFSRSRSGDAGRYSLRLVLSDLRRLDITAVVPTDRQAPPSIIQVDDEPASAVAELVNSFRFDAVLAAVKAARDDVLIGAHLTLQLARHVLVAAMLLRDRDSGTDHHRFGGSRWDAWATRLASAPTPYNRYGITAAIRYYTDALEEVLTDWDAELRSDNRPLLTLLDAVDEQSAARQMR